MSLMIVIQKTFYLVNSFDVDIILRWHLVNLFLTKSSLDG